MPLFDFTRLNAQEPAPVLTMGLSWPLLGATILVMALVIAFILIAAIRSRPDTAITRQAPAQDQHALIWAIAGGAGIPLILLVAGTFMNLSTHRTLTANASIGGGPEIEVIGHQWWWEVHYPAEGFATANEIHIPVGKTITLKLTSADVIHSFWIPKLHPQVEMLPGQTSTVALRADQVGTYQGECAQYCGIQHAHMDFVVIVNSQVDYDAWVAQQLQPAPNPPVGSLEKSGQQAFLGSACVYCHTIQGTNASGQLGPDLTHLASRLTLGAGTLPNTPANLAGWVENSQAIKPGNLMPPMDLDSDQLPAILAYLESLK